MKINLKLFLTRFSSWATRTRLWAAGASFFFQKKNNYDVTSWSDKIKTWTCACFCIFSQKEGKFIQTQNPERLLPPRFFPFPLALRQFLPVWRHNEPSKLQSGEARFLETQLAFSTPLVCGQSQRFYLRCTLRWNPTSLNTTLFFYEPFHHTFDH